MNAEPEALVLPDELVPRTAALLLRGGRAALSAVILLAGLPFLLTVGVTVLVDGSSSRREFNWATVFFPFVAALFRIACVFLIPLLAQAAPLAAFALAVRWRADRPRVGLVVETAFGASPGLIFPTLVMVVPASLIVFGLTTIQDTARFRGSGTPVLYVLAVLLIGLGAWVQGRFVHLKGAAHVLGVPTPVPRTAREHREVVALGVLPVSVVLAFVGQFFFRETVLAMVPGQYRDITVVVGGVVALVATLVGSSALAVAVASRR